LIRDWADGTAPDFPDWYIDPESGPEAAAIADSAAAIAAPVGATGSWGVNKNKINIAFSFSYI